MRPHLERGIELIAQEAHPEGRSLVRKYVYQEPAVRRVVNDCLREIFSTDIMCMVAQIQNNHRKIAARKKEIIEWEKDLIGSPKRSWNPLNASVPQLKEKIERNKVKNAADEKQNFPKNGFSIKVRGCDSRAFKELCWLLYDVLPSLY